MVTARKQVRRFRLDVPLAWLAFITAGGLALRLYQLGLQSYWFDEAQTLFVARFPFDEIVRRAYRPPLYHFLLHIWAKLVPNSEFWLRLPSALFGAAVPPLAYAVAARLYDRRTGLIACALAAISPVLVWYAQELRMYSLMALEFLLILYLFLRLAGEEPPRHKGLWTALLLAEIAALYTHYFAIPFLGWLVLISGLALFLARRRRVLVAWLGVQALAGLAYIPWLSVILGGRGGTEDYTAAEVLPVVTSVPGAREALSQSWRLYALGTLSEPPGVVNALSVAALVVLAIAVATLFVRALAAGYAARRRPAQPGDLAGTSSSDLYLLALMGGPFLTAVLMYKLRPGVVHPRHMMMIAGPLMVLLARIAGLAFDPRDGQGLRPQWLQGLLNSKSEPSAAPAPGRLANVLLTGRRFIGLATLLAFGATFLLALSLPYRDSRYQRPPVRSLARDIESMTGERDAILFSYTDFTFDEYYQGAAQTYRLHTTVGDEPLAGWLLPRIQDAGRAVLLRWVHVYADPRDFLPWLLQNNGTLHNRWWQAQRWVSVYDLRSPVVLPSLAPASVRIDPLRLRGVHLPQTAPADQPIPVALLWEATAPVPIDLKASVRIVDPSGHTVAADDRVLLGEYSPTGTSHWAPGTQAHNYYLLDLPPGSPPLCYTVVVSVYHEQGTLDVLNPQGAAMGTVHTLGTFQAQAPAAVPQSFSPAAMTPLGREVASGLLLEGYALDWDTVRAGEKVALTLYWRATQGTLPAYEPEVQLMSATGQLAGWQKGQPAYGQYPCSTWRQGELVIDRREVLLSPEAEPGATQIALMVGEGEPASLGQVTVEKADRAYTFDEIQHPLDVTLGSVARLRGYSLEQQTVRFGEPLRLTLYWEALSETTIERSYAVFTHLLTPDEQVIAQHDGLPAAGEWPTTAWIKGQAITDVHDLTFKDTPYEGKAILEVGLYDAKTFQRLATLSGDERILLPVEVEVMP